MTTDIKDLQILKAMYAAGDMLIEAGTVEIDATVKASDITKKNYAGMLWNDILPTSGQHDGFFVEISRSKIGRVCDEIKGIENKDICEMVRFHFVVDNFRCTVPAGMLFQMIRKFEQICGISSSTAHIFAPKKETRQGIIILRVELTSAIRALASFCGTDEIRPILTGVCFDTSFGVAVATDAHRLQVCPADMETMDKDARFVVPAFIVRKAKKGDILTVDSERKIYINGNYVDRLLDGEYPNWRSCFTYHGVNMRNMWSMGKDWSKVSKMIKSVSKGANECTHIVSIYFNGNKVAAYAEDVDFDSSRADSVTLPVDDNRKAMYISAQYDSLLMFKNVESVYLSETYNPIYFGMKNGIVGLCMPIMSENIPEDWKVENIEQGNNISSALEILNILGLGHGIVSTVSTNDDTVTSVDALADVEMYVGDWNTCTPASVEEHTDDTNDTDKIYLPVVSPVSVPAVIAPAKEEKAEEHTDTMQPVIISLPVATVQPVEALDAECVELVDDDTNDTDTDTNTTANDQEHTDHLLRRIFALAASYVAIVVMMVLAFGGNDNINANNIHTTAKESAQRVYFAAADTLTNDTTKTTIQRVYKGAPAVADTLAADTLVSDTLVSDTLASDTLVSDTLVSDSIEEHTDTIDTDTINSTPANLDDASDDTDTNSPAALAVIPLVLPVIGTRKNHKKSNENTNNNPSAMADTKRNKTMNATVTATKSMTSDMMQKFVNHIVEAKKTGEWDMPEKQYTGICGWAGVMSPDTRLACIEKFGMSDTLTAETMANDIIARRREFWNNSNAKLAQDAATANEQNNDYQPKAGDFVWGYNTNLKADGGLMGAVRDMVYCLDEEGREKAAMRELVHIEKVLSVPTTCEGWKNPAIIVARDPQHFPGGCQSLDVEKDVTFDDLCDEEKDTFFTVAAAVVDESGRWYLVDAEGLDYARYILFPANFETTFADELAAVRKENNAEKEAQALQEAQ